MLEAVLVPLGFRLALGHLAGSALAVVRTATPPPLAAAATAPAALSLATVGTAIAAAVLASVSAAVLHLAHGLAQRGIDGGLAGIDLLDRDGACLIEGLL